MNSKQKKTIGFLVPVQYHYSGTEFRDAVDRVFEAIWNELSPKKQTEIAKKFATDLEILNWRCE